jgi:hypothetical protein
VRFEKVARGRTVLVEFEPRDSLLTPDYQVGFLPETNAFQVILRRGGCFEGAYRCLQRWIEANAEQLDGIDSVPAGHLDLRCELQYWILERIYEQFLSDLESTVNDKVSWLEQTRPGEGVLGEVTVEARTRALVGLQAHLQRTGTEVSRGVLAPETIELWKSIGFNLLTSPLTSKP